jgi:hypothetical protein
MARQRHECAHIFRPVMRASNRLPIAVLHFAVADADARRRGG